MTKEKKTAAKEIAFKKVLCGTMCKKQKCRTCILSGDGYAWYKKPIADLLVEGGAKVVRTSGGRAWYE